MPKVSELIVWVSVPAWPLMLPGPPVAAVRLKLSPVAEKVSNDAVGTVAAALRVRVFPAIAVINVLAAMPLPVMDSPT